MYNFVLTCLIVVVILLIISILVQGSTGSSDLSQSANQDPSVYSRTRGEANFMTRLTGVLATIFMCLCLLLTFLTGKDASNKIVTSKNSSEKNEKTIDK